MIKKKAVVLLSGGIDSTTTLYLALNKKYKCYCLIFDYNQRHKREIIAAKKIATINNCEYKIIRVTLPWGSSALIDKKMELPQNRDLTKIKNEIPSTYVPARNTIFLAYALSYAETISANYIFIGANAIDYSGYPDCRPRYYQAFSKVAQLGTKMGVTGKKIIIQTPLINKSKVEIIKLATKLKVPLQLTWSCYRGGKKPCGVCDSCLLRRKGFEEANLSDPLYLPLSQKSCLIVSSVKNKMKSHRIIQND